MRTERNTMNSSVNCVAFTARPEQTTQHVGIIVVQVHIYIMYMNIQYTNMCIYTYDKQMYMRGTYVQEYRDTLSP